MAHARFPLRRQRRAAVAGLAALALAAGTSACTGDEKADAAPAAPVEQQAPVVAAGNPAATGTARACKGPASVAAPATPAKIAEKSTPVLPATVTDSTGAQIEISSAERVIAVGGSGTLATTMYLLGLGDRLVGRDAATLIPELQDLPQVTVNAHELSGEGILKLNPDLMLIDGGVGPPEVIEQVKASGVPVVSLPTVPGAAGIGPQIKTAAAAFGLSDLGNQLAARVETELAAVNARVATLVPDSSQRLRMAMLYLRGQSGVYTWLGAGSGADELIKTLNGVDVAVEQNIPSRTPLNAEAVAKANPQLVLLFAKGLESVGGAEGLKKVVGIANTEVGKTGCAVDVPDHLVLAFGPMYPAVLNALVTAVYEQAAPA
ncbi:MAG: ABC transporter substrate-binding protein [Sporichthyaceae bacterium]